MSWKNILKDDLNIKVREALRLWYGDDEDGLENYIGRGENITRDNIPNLIDDLEVVMASANYDPKTDIGLPKAIKALERLQ